MFTLLHQPFLNMVHKGGGGQKRPKGYTQNSTCFLSVFKNTHSTQDKWSLSPFFWLTEIFTSRLIRLNSFIFLSLEATCFFFFETVELSTSYLEVVRNPKVLIFWLTFLGQDFYVSFSSTHDTQLCTQFRFYGKLLVYIDQNYLIIYCLLLSDQGFYVKVDNITRPFILIQNEGCNERKWEVQNCSGVTPKNKFLLHPKIGESKYTMSVQNGVPMSNVYMFFTIFWKCHFKKMGFQSEFLTSNAMLCIFEGFGNFHNFALRKFAVCKPKTNKNEMST